MFAYTNRRLHVPCLVRCGGYFPYRAHIQWSVLPSGQGGGWSVVCHGPICKECVAVERMKMTQMMEMTAVMMMMMMVSREA